MTESVAVIQSKDNAESNALQAVKTALQEAVASINTESVSWVEKWNGTFQQQRQALDALHNEGFFTLESSLTALSTMIDDVAKDALQFTEAEKSLMQQAKALAEGASNAEIQRLRKQNQALVKLLDDEKLNAQKDQNDLVQRISCMIGDYMDERDRSLRQAVGLVHDENKRAREALSTFAADHESVMNSSHDRVAEMNSILHEKSKESKRTRDVAFKVSLFSHRHDIAMTFEHLSSHWMKYVRVSVLHLKPSTILYPKQRKHTRETYNTMLRACFPFVIPVSNSNYLLDYLWLIF